MKGLNGCEEFVTATRTRYGKLARNQALAEEPHCGTRQESLPSTGVAAKFSKLYFPLRRQGRWFESRRSRQFPSALGILKRQSNNSATYNAGKMKKIGYQVGEEGFYSRNLPGYPLCECQREPFRTRRTTCHRTAVLFFALPQTFRVRGFENISGSQFDPGLSKAYRLFQCPSQICLTIAADDQTL
jgi:hypothetical protein